MIFIGCNTPTSDKVGNTISKKLNTPQLIQDISIVNLISNPALYNRKIVRLIGYLNLEFEGNAIYFHEEDYKKEISKNAMWLNLSKEVMHSKIYQDNNKRYVIIVGTFDMLNNGHENSFSGTITNISRLESMNNKH